MQDKLCQHATHNYANMQLVNIIILHFNINKLLVNIIVLRDDINYLAYRGSIYISPYVNAQLLLIKKYGCILLHPPFLPDMLLQNGSTCNIITFTCDMILSTCKPFVLNYIERRHYYLHVDIN